ncbi:MAG: thiamine-phosphate kinase, partial [Candidatus Hydromicrobium americanum]
MKIDISQIGGEFALIKRLTKKPVSRYIIKGIGDDAALVKVGNR